MEQAIDPLLFPSPAALTAEEILKRYSEERSKRFSARPPDGSARDIILPLPSPSPSPSPSLSPQLRRLQDDPWVDHDLLNARQQPPHPPPALVDGQHVDFLIVGAGHAGLLFASSLIDAGAATPERIRLVDAAGGFGGAWYWNRYPGLMCDMESSVYMPLLEETGYVPVHRYAYGEELRAHAERVARAWRLADKALFRSVVRRMVWDEREKEWEVEVTEYRGPVLGHREIAVRARRPRMPKAPGFEDFKPHCFHTARWDYNYTGGSPEDPRLEKLMEKRVGVIGTGATGVQLIPELARWAKELYVFQRTPASVDTRNQRLTTAEAWQAMVATSPGWQAKRMNNFAAHVTKTPTAEKNLVKDGWTKPSAFGVQVGSDAWGTITPDKVDKHVATVHALDLARMQCLRRRVDEVVRDTETAEKLKPWYPSWCKRPAFHDDYLFTFNRPNVHLVDTDGQGVERFTEDAVVVAGVEYPVDVLVFATGYRFPRHGNASPAHIADVEVIGVGGRGMDEKWDAEEGVATLHGYVTNGFPNLFFPGPAQAGLGPNTTHMLTLMARHVAFVVARAKGAADARGWRRFSVAAGAPFFAPAVGCTPGIVNDDGRKDDGPPPRNRKEALRKARGMCGRGDPVFWGNIEEVEGGRELGWT
ncbi:hypothetical protein B0J12DRAFT_750866 [Macrophomina phaseolina]|uniref:Flavin-containing monooxygenase-like protein n=1 Tax=Macrophomina phaseolina TaxID=35725 RepID=A0ABQ8GEI7_9PEZI|nr:hypothetical protein B0J12DRAFT_750866 [Macrophomina phaseolina]